MKGIIRKIHSGSKTYPDGYKIPFYDEIIKMVKKTHSYLDKIHSLGWDVAISPKEPILIESNDNFGEKYNAVRSRPQRKMGVNVQIGSK